MVLTERRPHFVRPLASVLSRIKVANALRESAAAWGRHSCLRTGFPACPAASKAAAATIGHRMGCKELSET